MHSKILLNMGKNKKKKKNKTRQFQNKPSHWGRNIKYIIVASSFIIVIFSCIQDCIGNKKIKNNGKITTGWVYDKGVGRRCNDVRHYYFFVNGKKYTGQSSHDDNLNVDDQIKVVYYPENPSINRSWNSYIRILKDD